MYNTFPVPDSPLDVLEKPAQAVWDARAAHPDLALVDLYDPLTMPADLVRAHRKLDRQVDRMYRPKPFQNNDERLEYLMRSYAEITKDA